MNTAKRYLGNTMAGFLGNFEFLRYRYPNFHSPLRTKVSGLVSPALIRDMQKLRCRGGVKTSVISRHCDPTDICDRGTHQVPVHTLFHNHGYGIGQLSC